MKGSLVRLAYLNTKKWLEANKLEATDTSTELKPPWFLVAGCVKDLDISCHSGNQQPLTSGNPRERQGYIPLLQQEVVAALRSDLSLPSVLCVP